MSHLIWLGVLIVATFAVVGLLLHFPPETGMQQLYAGALSFLLVIAWAFLLAAAASAHHGHGCKTKKCHRRVALKQLAKKPHRPAVASWYGPGLYGNPLGCSAYGRLYPGTLGVAHKTLRCGQRIRVCYDRCVVTRVIDRGPYVAGREFDLTAATRNAIGFPNGVATIRVAVG